MDTQTLLNVGLVLIFVLIGGVFAATELALVSLRESLPRWSARARGVRESLRSLVTPTDSWLRCR